MIWRVEVAANKKVFSIIIDAHLDTPTTELIKEIERIGVSAKPLTIAGKDISTFKDFADLPLKDGSRIIAGEGNNIERELPGLLPSGYYLLNVSGPEAGSYCFLKRGKTTIGRDKICSHTINDHYLSREHASVVIDADNTILLEDHSRNGTLLEGKIISNEQVEMALGFCFHIGSSLLTIIEHHASDVAVLTEDSGPHSTFQCRFRSAEEAPLIAMKQPSSPGKGSSASYSWWQGLMPLATGVFFAIQRGNPWFLLIAVLSPVMLAGTAFWRSKKEAKNRRDSIAEYEVESLEFEQHVEDQKQAEASLERRQSYGLGFGFFASLARGSRLWNRRSSDADFGSVTVGYGALASQLKIPDQTAVQSWNVPVSVSLLETGSLSVLGAQQETLPVLRSLLLDLAASHSPTDIQLWIFSEVARADEWGFAQWLPHVQTAGMQACMAFTQDDRNVLFQSLKQELDTRSEAQQKNSKNIPLPLHIVVLDSSSLLAESELSELLQAGQKVGIAAIVADQSVVPQGANAQLRLQGSCDEALFESIQQPLVENLMVSRVSIALAEKVARSLAPLRPALTSGSTMPSNISLVDLLGVEDIDAEAVLANWQRISPRTGAVVGLSTEVPVSIDIVKHGPHGLVGGMSGSGKTEFLMTYLTSLCLNNHPDDLAIVIVDFKGGVDHALSAELPHVISLTTNLEIEKFKRTIQLLDAEQDRRQAMLAGIGDIAAYQKARKEDPSMEALPRLLVIVDEFSQLLASEEGKARLKDLTEISRIGRALGIHLLLVTQSFEGKLSSDIESNAGLRVCLRVTKPSHSKIVLESGIAATISEKTIGRAYARLNSSDLTEFQTARVAGKRRSLISQTAPCNVVVAPLETLASLAITSADDKCPADQTNMHYLVSAMNGAARLAKSEKVVPWPEELAEDRGAEWLQEKQKSQVQGEHIVGEQDVPLQQRQIPFALIEEQALLVGGSRAHLEDVLSSIAYAISSSSSPNDYHIHGLDPKGVGLSVLSELAHCGTIATRDPKLSVRLLKYLVTEVASRRALLVRHKVTSIEALEEATGKKLPQIYLLVADADRMVRAQDESWHTTQAELVRLVADSVGTGVRLVIAGNQRITESRIGSTIDQRYVFSLPTGVPPTAYGVPRDLAVSLEVPGRCVDTQSKLLTQFALLKAPFNVSQLGEQPLEHPPKQLLNITWPFLIDELSLKPTPDGFDLPLAAGVQIDSGAPSWLDVAEDGPLFGITGSPSSGRSNCLLAIGRLARDMDYNVVAVAGSRRSPLTKDEYASCFSKICEPSSIVSAVKEFGDAPTVLLIDDAQRLDDDHLKFSELFRSKKFAAFLSGSNEFLESRRLKELPKIRSGIALVPKGGRDATCLGLRSIPSAELVDRRPGQGLLVVGGEVSNMQVPFVSVS